MKKSQIDKRKNRVRARLHAVTDRPRLAVYRTNAHIWAQLIGKDGKVIAAESSKALKAKGTKTEVASAVGSSIAKKALDKKVKEVAYDRGAYRYHGRIKALAEAARKEGLVF